MNARFHICFEESDIKERLEGFASIKELSEFSDLVQDCQKCQQLWSQAIREFADRILSNISEGDMVEFRKHVDMLVSWPALVVFGLTDHINECVQSVAAFYEGRVEPENRQLLISFLSAVAAEMAGRILMSASLGKKERVEPGRTIIKAVFRMMEERLRFTDEKIKISVSFGDEKGG